MTHVFIDFETYYDTKCNVEALGVSQTVKHPDFKVHMCAVAVDENPPFILDSDDECRRFFGSVLPKMNNVVLVAHNMQFDGYIAYHRYGYVAPSYRCTLSMAAPIYQQFAPLSLDSVAKLTGAPRKRKGVLETTKGIKDLSPELFEALADYNIDDVLALRGIYDALLPQIPLRELQLIDLTMKMFCDPVLLVDGALAKYVYEHESDRKEALALEAGFEAAVFRSSAKLAKALEDLGYEVPYKYSEKQDKMIPALAQDDPQFIRFRDEADARLRKILRARKAVNSNLVKSRSKALLARADEPLPVGLKYCGAHTMRFSGNDKVNLQNLPSRDFPGLLRRCLTAPPGHTLVIVDAAQIEARITAWLAGQNDLVEGFRNREDVYSNFASKLFNKSVNKKDHPNERFIGKTCILGLGYGMGAKRLQESLLIGRGGPSLDLEIAECYKYVQTYRTTYYRIPALWNRIDEVGGILAGKGNHFRIGPCLVRAGQIEMPNGFSLWYPNTKLYYNDRFERYELTFKPYGAEKPIKLWGGALTENIVQSLARTVTSYHMLELSKRWKVVLMAHDEIVMCVPEAAAPECLTEALFTLSEAPSWGSDIPLEGEGCISKTYTK